MKKVLLVGLAVVALAGCSKKPAADQMMVPSTESTANTQTDAMMKPLEMMLAEQNTSGQTGKVTLEDGDGEVIVTISMEGTKSTVPQPAHIHTGACPNPGAVKYPLEDVVDGKSVTRIDAKTVEELKQEMPLAINVHKSATESKVYTACGDIK